MQNCPCKTAHTAVHKLHMKQTAKMLKVTKLGTVAKHNLNTLEIMTDNPHKIACFVKK
jgi:hypothetical protein